MSVADEERAAFERYMSSDIGPADLKRSPAGHYESAWTRGAWFGWIARSLEIDALRGALADATERAEANATEVHLLGERVRIECERRDQARRERDAATEREGPRRRLEALLYGEGQDDVPESLGDLLDAAADEIEHHREVALDATADAQARRCIEDIERQRDAAIARADALAARLAEVDDREHPA